jgi:multiple sugar transport system substrate-binding protein
MKRNRLLLAFLGISLLFAALSPVNFAKTKIRMWTFLNPDGKSPREVALKEITKNFERDYPYIEVLVEPLPFNTIPAKFFASHVSGTAPDVIWMSFRDIGEAVKLHSLEDLNKLFINKWTKEQKKDMADIFWNYAANASKRYQITFSRSADMLIYRADLFREKGIKTPLKSWKELIEAAKKLTEDTNGDGTIDRWGFGQQFGVEKPVGSIFVPSMIELQKKMFTDKGSPLWATKAGIQSMKLATDMVTKYKVTPSASVSYSQEDLIQGFAAGKYAIITAAAVRVPTIRTMVTFNPLDVKLAHFPSWSGKTFGSGILSGWGVGIWSKSRNKNEAAKLLEYMVNKESERIWILTGTQVPFRSSTLNKMSDYFQKPENNFLKIMMEEFGQLGWTCPWQFPISGYDIQQNAAAQKIIINGKDIKEALTEAENEFKSQNK